METTNDAHVVGVVTQIESGQTRYTVRINAPALAQPVNLYVLMNARGKKEDTVPADDFSVTHWKKAEFRARAWWAVCAYIAEVNKATPANVR